MIPPRPEPGTIMDDDQIEALVRQEDRFRLIERCARAVYYELFAAAGQKSELPKAFDKLQPATKERCEVIALRVLQTAGVLSR